MTFKENYHGYVKLAQGDPGFAVNDGVVLYQRACLDISKDCPEDVKNQIRKYYSKGWLRAVAYVHESELMFDQIKGVQNVDN